MATERSVSDLVRFDIDPCNEIEVLLLSDGSVVVTNTDYDFGWCLTLTPEQATSLGLALTGYGEPPHSRKDIGHD